MKIVNECSLIDFKKSAVIAVVFQFNVTIDTKGGVSICLD
jgi:hypothetical protein